MSKYAKFLVGGDRDKFEYVQFKPAQGDGTATNYLGATCYYRAGSWFCPDGYGMPRFEKDGPNWGTPGTPVACAWPACACVAAVRCPGALAGPVTVEPPPMVDQAFKADDGKPNWFLLMSGKGCAAALAGVVRVLSFAVRPVAAGGKGYTEHSWRQVPNARERYEAALYRHLNKLALGEAVDDESGESHWDHVATNALFLSELTKAAK